MLCVLYIGNREVCKAERHSMSFVIALFDFILLIVRQNKKYIHEITHTRQTSTYPAQPDPTNDSPATY